MTRNTLANTTTTTIAVAADYADAMMTARKAKNALFLVLLLILLTQLALFFLLRFNVLSLGDEVAVEHSPDAAAVQASDTSTAATAPATQAVEAATQPATMETADENTEATASTETHRRSSRVQDLLRYLIPVTDFLGVTLVIVMAVVLLLIVAIMLVGRLIGVSHVTSAFIWCVVLAVLMFPWQALLIGATSGSPGEVPSPYAAAEDQHPAFKIPGVLYTWPELKRDLYFPAGGLQGVLKWVRFAGMPVVAMFLLLMIQARSSRGLKFALGESEVQVEVSAPGV